MAANVAATQSSLCYPSGPEICTMQQQNPDIQQAAKWLHLNSIPLTIPQGSTYLRTLWHQRAYLTLRDGILYRHWSGYTVRLFPKEKVQNFIALGKVHLKLVKKIGSVVYRIQQVQNPRKRVVVHANRLKRYHCQREDEHSQEDWIILPSTEEQVDETISPLQTAQEDSSRQWVNRKRHRVLVYWL